MLTVPYTSSLSSVNLVREAKAGMKQKLKQSNKQRQKTRLTGLDRRQRGRWGRHLQGSSGGLHERLPRRASVQPLEGEEMGKVSYCADEISKKS